MWVLDWFRNKRRKKAFRVIKVTNACQTKQSMHLVIPKQRKILQVQKTIVERVIEKHQKQLQAVQPVHVQVIDLHLHPTHRYVQRSMNVLDLKKQKQQKQELRQEILRLQRIGFLEEQAYFRTRPTLAKQLLHDLFIGKKPTYVRGSENIRPIHLEILKQVVTQETNKEMADSSIIQEHTPHSSALPREWVNQLIKEVIRQLQKDAYRTGGAASWRK